MAMLKMTSNKTGLRSRINRFFHEEETPYGIALVRMFVPLALLASMVTRWSRAREIYSMDGASTPLWNSYGMPNMLPEISGVIAVGMVTLLMMTLITASIGWCTRVSLAIAFTSYTYLSMLDAVSTITKYSVIASHVLLLLALSQCGAVWSVDSWLKRRRERASQGGLSSELAIPKSAAWPRRLLQIMIGAVYFGAAMTKLHTPAYFSGDQMVTWMQTNVNFANPVGEWMSLYSTLIVFFSYIAVVWEVTFIFLCWRGFGRIAMLTLGVMFHVMTTVMLGLIIFPLICIPIYFAFLNEEDFRNLTWRWMRLKQKFGWDKRPNRVTISATVKPTGTAAIPSPMVFAGVVMLVVLAGIEIEHRMDPFGIRRPEGPYALKELDPEYVETVLLRRAVPMRTEDMVSDFRAGTVLIGGNLFNPKRDFRIGEKVIVQAWISPPHEDMIFYCNLHDAEDHVVDTRPQQALREMARCNFYYTLSSALEPGDYFFVLKRADKELMRKRIRIHPGQKPLVAN
jgi:hypothetical protein